MREAPDIRWWVLLAAALLIVFVWPPIDDRSLAIKLVNWAADPRHDLPVRPAPLPMELGDDLATAAAHDRQLQEYDALYAKGGWIRTRLRLKVARDPFDARTERQVLTAAAVVIAFLALRLRNDGA